ncbi:hypothetical protein QCN27_17730 [Cereibacter sp. SYSU M97828]|nr:hypothetical protein [Cereibacter flavus]
MFTAISQIIAALVGTGTGPYLASTAQKAPTVAEQVGSAAEQKDIELLTLCATAGRVDAFALIFGRQDDTPFGSACADAKAE